MKESRTRILPAVRMFWMRAARRMPKQLSVVKKATIRQAKAWAPPTWRLQAPEPMVNVELAGLSAG